MSEKPVTHGIEHRPSSYDPTQTDPWTYISDGDTAWDPSVEYNPGDTAENESGTFVYPPFVYLCLIQNTDVEPGNDPDWARYWHIAAPVFQNGWTNSGGSLAAMRYRLSVGPPHVLDGNDGTVIDLSDHQVEIQGSCYGGSNATVVFALPPAYAPDADLRLSASDDAGAFVVLQVLTTGAVVRGI